MRKSNTLRGCRWVLLALVLAGCGGAGDGSQPVQGTLSMNGAELKTSGSNTDGWVELRFLPLDAQGNSNGTFHQTQVGTKGHFQVLGPSNKGLPPGKYRIAVFQFDPYPTDKLGGRFDEANSPITREITGPTKLELDLAKLAEPRP